VCQFPHPSFQLVEVANELFIILVSWVRMKLAYPSEEWYAVRYLVERIIIGSREHSVSILAGKVVTAGIRRFRVPLVKGFAGVCEKA
jgi:hypothetical protein